MKKKKQHDLDVEATVTLRLWTYEDAVKAVPYLRSLAQSLRDGWLEMRQAQEQVRRIESRPGRADRDSLIQLDDSNRDIARAEAKLDETMHEMLALSAYCVDPGAGLAVIPFLRGEALAWFVFDLFDPKGLVAWRFYSDPLEMRRPLADLDQPIPAPTAA